MLKEDLKEQKGSKGQKFMFIKTFFFFQEIKQKKIFVKDFDLKK